MVKCDWTEREITIKTSPAVKNAMVQYGIEGGVINEIETNSDGIASFCWPATVTVFVSLHKIDYVFSDLIIPPQVPNCYFPYPKCVNWGGSSKWYRMLPWVGSKTIRSFEKPPELPPVEDVIEEIEEVIEEVIEEIIEAVCQTEADPTVPAALSAYFPISIRNARWICNGVAENITGVKGIIKINGSEIARIPIRNGYGSPINLGTISEFKNILKELVG